MSYIWCNLYDMHRTTVFLEETLLRRARRYARQHGKSFAALVRESIAAYIGGDKRGAQRPSFADQFHSSAPTVPEPRPLFGRSKGRIRIVGDIVAPINADWDVGEDY